MEPLVIVLFVIGLVLLTVGAELLVRGASALAGRIGISPLVIGLTVVAFGTSAPELAVSVRAGLSGQPDIALGNVVGSNIVNVLLVLGLSALIVPLVVQRQLVWLDVPLLIGASVLLLVMSLDGRVGMFDGFLLFVGVVGYTAFVVRHSRRIGGAGGPASDGAPPAGADSAPAPSGGGLAAQLGLVLAGLAMLVLGAHWLVNGAVAMARLFGVSELIIGLTIVAGGTSLPELATTVVASIRGERDIAVGNAVGSCLFNIFAIAGISAMVTPGGLAVAPALVGFDLPVMIATALACLPIFATGHLIARWEGAMFLGYYVAYVLYLVMAATAHDALAGFSSTMLGFIMPITAVTLIVLLMRHKAGVEAGRT